MFILNVRNKFFFPEKCHYLLKTLVQPPIRQRRSLFRQEEGTQLQQLTLLKSVTWLENKPSVQSNNFVLIPQYLVLINKV